MKNKKVKLIAFFAGLIFLSLWIYNLFNFYSLEQVLYGIKVIYFTFGLVIWLPLILVPTGVFDDGNKEDGKHSCDFCGKKMKIAEGKHWLKKDGCVCACDICLPTVDDRNL